MATINYTTSEAGVVVSATHEGTTRTVIGADRFKLIELYKMPFVEIGALPRKIPDFLDRADQATNVIYRDVPASESDVIITCAEAKLLASAKVEKTLALDKLVMFVSGKSADTVCAELGSKRFDKAEKASIKAFQSISEVGGLGWPEYRAVAAALGIDK